MVTARFAPVLIGVFSFTIKNNWLNLSMGLLGRNWTGSAQRIAKGLTCGAVIGWVLFSPPAVADIYKYIDSDGVMHFTNVPISSGYELFIKERPETVTNSRLTDKYDYHIVQASRKHDIDFSLLKAVIKVESNFDPRAVSTKGAKGLMQIMPENYERLNIQDPFDPEQNIMGGATYLKRLIQRYSGKLPLALAAYNAGPSAVARYNNQIPPYPETEAYIERVMKFYEQLNR